MSTAVATHFYCTSQSNRRHYLQCKICLSEVIFTCTLLTTNTGCSKRAFQGQIFVLLVTIIITRTTINRIDFWLWSVSPPKVLFLWLRAFKHFCRPASRMECYSVRAKTPDLVQMLIFEIRGTIPRGIRRDSLKNDRRNGSSLFFLFWFPIHSEEVMC